MKGRWLVKVGKKKKDAVRGENRYWKFGKVREGKKAWGVKNRELATMKGREVW